MLNISSRSAVNLPVFLLQSGSEKSVRSQSGYSVTRSQPSSQPRAAHSAGVGAGRSVAVCAKKSISKKTSNGCLQPEVS